MARSGSWTRRLLFTTILVSVFFGGAEIGMRVLGTPPADAQQEGPGILLTPHTTRIWGNLSGTQEVDGITYRIDTQGLREQTGRTGDYRILTLGDSSVFGHGLERSDTLHA